MTLGKSITRAPRCSLVNVWSGESIECLLNPTELVEKLQINWNRLVVPGLSHQVLQFQSTGNRQLSGVEFYLDRFFAAEQPGAPEILEFRKFLMALTVPPQALESVTSAAPPRVLIVWPRVLTIECVLTAVDFQYRQFAGDGQVLVYTASASFEEILDVRITSENRRRE